MRCILLALVALLLAFPALAHDPQLSGLRIILRDGTTLVSATTHLSTLSAAEKKVLDPPGIDLAFRKRVALRLDGKDFAPEQSRVQRDDANDLVTWQASQPGEATVLEIRQRLYPDDPTSGLVVSVLKGETLLNEAILNAQHPSLRIEPDVPESLSATLWRFVRLGVHHLWSGPDHLCFLLGLLLLGGSLRQLLTTVTAFTVAHSITLTLAVRGWVTPSPRWIEPLIALSIVAIAAENLRPRKPDTPDRRPWFALGFGLIHGFGFAGALAETGLPSSGIGWALAAFNGGVELGQAAIVVAVAPLLTLLQRRFPQRAATVNRYLAWGIGFLGLYWLVIRLQ